MNTKKSMNGYEFVKNVNFLGRSGIVEIKGLRVGYISGIDSDLLGETVFKDDSDKYKANYFGKEDV
jgi:hypothetical protein